MRVVVEVVADEREDVAYLLREAARRVRKSTEKHGAEVNYCAGDYRIFVEGDLYPDQKIPTLISDDDD